MNNSSAIDTHSDNSDNDRIWTNLIQWVHQSGGQVHDALKLQGSGPSRGVFATHTIEKGETLIRLPPGCVISGGNVSRTDVSTNTPASPWLKCVAAYFQACSHSKRMVSSTGTAKSSAWQAYLDSLPDHYETLFQWTDEQIQMYLAGTTLGDLVQADRNDGTMRQRYQFSVRPFLQALNLLDQDNGDESTTRDDVVSDSEYDTFLRACMTISTRGFHLSQDSTIHENADNGFPFDDDNCGPFLLPVIDLLNHNPPQKCTTLHRDNATGNFGMVAERSISKGEEVLHSYGDSLTAAQLLQTFGFVPIAKKTPSSPFTWTPARLDKTKHLLRACETIKSSEIPNKLQSKVQAQQNDGSEEEEEGEESWDVSSIPNRPLNNEDQVPNDWLLSMENVLTDELITFLVLQFLPTEAHDEIVSSNGTILAWLDSSILDDYYTGGLVCHALLEAIRRKETDYTTIQKGNDDLNSFYGSHSEQHPLQRDEEMLHRLLAISNPTIEQYRAMYGLSIRIEELKCLEALSDQVHRILNSLDNGESVDLSIPPAKKAKLNQTTPFASAE